MLRAGPVLIAVLAVPAAMIWGVIIGVRALAHASLAGNELFTLRQYELHSDGRLTPALIREYAALPEEGVNVFALDLRAIRERLERVPRVRSATTALRLPDTLVIHVVERAAIAHVHIEGRPFMLAVDRMGHVLGPSSALPHLPVIEGVRQPGLGPGGVVTDAAARDALSLLDLCDRTPIGRRLQISRIAVSDSDRMDVRLAGGEHVWMPRHGVERKLRELMSILWAIEDLRMAPDRNRIVIDMTTDERFPVRGLAPGQTAAGTTG